MNVLDFEQTLSLLRKGEDFVLRDYQVKAARNIVEKGNSLLIMPTAMGKTFVAVLVIAHLIGKNWKKVLFLTPTKPLAVQQADRLRKFLNLKETDVQVLSGDVSPEERGKVWKDGLVFSATPQTVANDLMTGRIDLKEFQAVFFDEVHKAVGDYDYVFISNAAKGLDVLTVGMTASPSSEDEKVQEICNNLNVKNVEIFDESDAERYVNDIKVQFRFVKLSKELLEIRDGLRRLLSEICIQLKPFGLVKASPSKRDLLDLRTGLLKLVNSSPEVFKALSLQAKAMNLVHAIDLVESESLETFCDFINSMAGRKSKSKAVLSLISDERVNAIKLHAMQLVERGVEHPKIDELKRIVVPAVADGNVIVFVNFRNSITKIVRELNNLPGISARQFIGKTNGMTRKLQVSTIQDFRGGKFNVMVASSIGEEGLDIPSVDTVVFYEPVPSEIRAIQRRGRTGRHREGKAIILIAQGTKDEAFYWISRKKEKQMKENMRELRQALQKNAAGKQEGGKVDYVEQVKPPSLIADVKIKQKKEVIGEKKESVQKSLDEYL